MISSGIDAVIPTKNIGPILLNWQNEKHEIFAPLTTLETPLWYSVNRGALISRECGGINCVVKSSTMARSVVVKCQNCLTAMQINDKVLSSLDEVKQVVESTSRYVKFVSLLSEIVGNQIFFRLAINPCEASGHNMSTKAAEAFLVWVTKNFACEYLSISGNFCTDKKVSAVNGILGRGKNVTSEIVIPREVCEKKLKTTPEKINELNVSKNFVGSTIAGSIRSANAHYANMLLAIYLATGQDSANIVEGSQGITYTSINDDGSLYFSVNLPNIVIGTLGNGKDVDFAVQNLKLMGCEGNSEKLAAIIGAVVLCGELSLLAALTNEGELMKAHISLERRKNDRN